MDRDKSSELPRMQIGFIDACMPVYMVWAAVSVAYTRYQRSLTGTITKNIGNADDITITIGDSRLPFSHRRQWKIFHRVHMKWKTSSRSFPTHYCIIFSHFHSSYAISRILTSGTARLLFRVGHNPFHFPFLHFLSLVPSLPLLPLYLPTTPSFPWGPIYPLDSAGSPEERCKIPSESGWRQSPNSFWCLLR